MARWIGSAFVMTGLLIAGGCGSTDATLIKVDGSSTVYPITEAVAEEFQKANRGARVTVGISGTGGGFKKFCAGEIDVADASRPIKQVEIDACSKSGVEYVELPVAYDGIAVVVSAKNTWATSMTTAELKKLWEPEAQGKVMKWSDIRADWPNKEIHLFGAGVDSGTYDYFTEQINHKEHASRGDYTSSEDDNVLVQGIAGDELALGFFGYGYYQENSGKLKALTIDDEKADNGAGAIAPSPDTIRNGTYQPLSRPIFVYVSKKSLDRADIASFARFYLDKAPTFAAEVGYVALPDNAYALATKRLDGKVVGSMYGGKGSQPGVTVEALLERSGK